MFLFVSGNGSWKFSHFVICVGSVALFPGGSHSLKVSDVPTLKGELLKTCSLLKDDENEQSLAWPEFC